MAAIKEISELLKNMKPKLIEGEYIFYTTNQADQSLNPVMTFKEEEGTTLIIKKETADSRSIPYSDVWAWITLTVHSDLAAVGFLAAITDKLAKEGISVNAISAYYHDHLFVPKEKTEEAMNALNELSK